MQRVLKSLPTSARFPDSTGELLDVYGYGAPLWLDDPASEYAVVRSRAGLIDFSMLYKLDVEGPGALEVVNSVVCRDLTRLVPGRLAYGPIVDEHGMMVDDCTTIVFSPDHVRLTGGTPVDEQVLRDATTGTRVAVVDRREELVHLCLQGPASRKVLTRLTEIDVSNSAFPYYAWRSGVEVAGIPAHVNRLGFTGELGYEIWAARESALELWDALVENGATGFGAAALMSLRTEVGYLMGDGVDYDGSVTPYECGLGWAVDLDKGEFRGREALLKACEDVRRRLVSIVVDAEPEPAAGAPLSLDGELVGHLHMPVPSPHVGGKTLSLARVRASTAEVGTALSASIGGSEVSADVVPTPVYDPSRARVRS